MKLALTAAIAGLGMFLAQAGHAAPAQPVNPIKGTPPANVRTGVTPAAPGKPLSSFRMADRAGNTHTNADFKGKTTVLVFSNPNSPASRNAEQDGQLAELARLGPNVKVAKVQVGGVVDSQNGPQKRTPTPNQPTTLMDLNNETSKKLGINQSQTVVVIDGEGKVVYQGAMDNDPGKTLAPGERKNYAKDAVQATLKGETPPVAQTSSNGDPLTFKKTDISTPKIEGENPETKADNK